MKGTPKYQWLTLLVVGAVSSCNNNESRIFDPTQGSGQTSVQEVLSRTPGAPAITGRQKEIQLMYSEADYLRCQTEYENAVRGGGEFSEFCNQFLMQFLSLNGLMQYSQLPDEVGINFAQPGQPAAIYQFPWRSWANQNPAYMNQFNRQYGHYLTPVNMGQACANPASITRVNVGTGCGNISYYYGYINLRNNLAYNQMMQGNLGAGAQLYAPGGFMQQRCAPIYTGAHQYATAMGTYYSGGTQPRVSLRDQNQQLWGSLQGKWDDFKNLPANVGLRVADTFLGAGLAIADSTLTQALSRVELAASNIVTRNMIATANARAAIAYNQSQVVYAQSVCQMGPMCAGAYAATAATLDQGSAEPECVSGHYEWTVTSGAGLDGEGVVVCK